MLSQDLSLPPGWQPGAGLSPWPTCLPWSRTGGAATLLLSGLRCAPSFREPRAGARRAWTDRRDRVSLNEPQDRQRPGLRAPGGSTLAGEPRPHQVSGAVGAGWRQRSSRERLSASHQTRYSCPRTFRLASVRAGRLLTSQTGSPWPREAGECRASHRNVSVKH